ncbi:MAG: AmmeMemoRadiSam system protein B [Actinobacteria bacterium 13_2_20CM_2_71_6]|nr:MAG: AmmeMemoRadiSam system protein B [Actinobacteria bacterium 13_2_20CM_2_71_6]
MPESHRRPNWSPEHQVRPPAVAGRFYPADPGDLAALVDGLLDAGGAEAAIEEPGPAYVVPHAALRYSGPTAAHVYARLRRPGTGTVVLLGPAHYVPAQGCVVPAAQRWRTPLGEVPVDAELVASLAHDGHVRVDDRPFVPEHSLEVQLPFLQRCRPDGLRVLPVVVGQSTVDDVVVTLSALAEAAGPDAILVCSTDLSHYQPEAAAEAQDARTCQAVLDLAAERIGARDACGVFALRGLVGWARLRGLRARLLDRCTSAKTGGDASRVVGYAAFAFN